MPLPQSCPDEPSWRRLLDDQVDGDERDLLEAHLDDCGPCRERLALLEGLPSDQVATAASLGGTPAQSLLDQIGLDQSAKADSATRAAKPPQLPGFDDFVQIGRGGMGVVYRAHDVERDRPVAVKVLSNAARLDAGALSRALREARALERLDHPNIVRVFETGETDGLPYIVMEWVEGGDLGDRLAKVPLPPG